MKILIVGDAGSIFIKQFVEYVLVGKGHEIVIIQEALKVPPKYLEFYNENNVTLEPMNKGLNKLIMKLPVVRSILGCRVWSWMISRKYKEFDIVHVHGLNRSRGNAGKYLRNKTKKMIISVWGDEIFKKSKDILKKYEAYYDLADTITVSTKAMYDTFSREYSDKYKERVHTNKFAIGEFEIIDKVKEEVSRDELCKEFGISSPDKAIVLVGHNGRESQRHFEITGALKKLPREKLDKIALVYTMTYGVKSAEYLAELENEAKSLGCEYVILTEFLDELKIAKLRCMTDILLHAQKTDAFSASIQESLYAETIVFNGDWLKYTDLPDSEERLVEYSDFDDMVKKLDFVLDNIPMYKDKFKDNQAVLRNISSREVTTRAWLDTLGLK